MMRTQGLAAFMKRIARHADAAVASAVALGNEEFANHCRQHRAEARLARDIVLRLLSAAYRLRELGFFDAPRVSNDGADLKHAVGAMRGALHQCDIQMCVGSWDPWPGDAPAELDAANVARVLQPLLDLAEVGRWNGPSERALVTLILPGDARDLTVREVLALMEQVREQVNGCAGGTA